MAGMLNGSLHESYCIFLVFI